MKIDIQNSSQKLDGPFLKYHLVQQTPMIHFQHDEPGACLRASEVKPKLDRFLLQVLGKKITGKEDYQAGITEARKKGWLLGEHAALNYKMRITTNSNEPIYSGSIYSSLMDERDKALTIKNDRGERVPRDNPNTKLAYFIDSEILSNPYIIHINDNRIGGNTKEGKLFFANQVGGEIFSKVKNMISKYKETVFYLDDIDLKMVCFIPELKDYIDRNISLFFLLHNFGTRQTKGYGSFILKEKTTEELLNEHFKGEFYFDVSFNTNDDNNEKGNKMLDAVRRFYQNTKNGINNPFKHSYQKSYLMKEYFAGELNEKKAMKLELLRTGEFKLKETRAERGIAYYDDGFGKIDLSTPPIPSIVNPYYIRGLLGYAGKYIFKDVELLSDSSVPKKRFDLAFTVDGHGIDRFASPVIFKPVLNADKRGAKVFLILKPEQLELLDGKSITLSCDIEKCNDRSLESKIRRVIGNADSPLISINMPVMNNKPGLTNFFKDFLYDFFSSIYIAGTKPGNIGLKRL